MAYSDTLLVRHIPSLLSTSEVEDLLKHLGAINVSTLGSDVKDLIAFAKFKTKDVAKEVLFRLHQQELFGQRLVVEFANSNECISRESSDKVQKREIDRKIKLHETFLQNLNNWTIGLNFTLPPPCHLRYQYPAPTAEILLNIVNLLSHNKKFYIQVVHLMNKMNLPSPFESSFSIQQNELFNSLILYVLQNSVYEQDQSSEEGSEIESETESKKVCTVFSKKRAMPYKKIAQTKKLFKSSIVSKKTVNNKSDLLNTKSKIQMDDVFETVERDRVKKIEVRMPTEISATNTTLTEEDTVGFGIINPAKKRKDSEIKEPSEENISKFISSVELESNRIGEKDQKALPIFKNYDIGVPSCRLYIKNLSKHVTVNDLEYIFRRYFVEGIDEQGTMFDVRLMQEGRMKGQAFITLQSVKQAEIALNETNGYILKDKPMVVQFARSASTK